MPLQFRSDVKVLLDYRLRSAGAGRYGASLLEGFDLVGEDQLDINTTDLGNGLQNLLRLPFTPWGRRYVARCARRLQPDVIHGLHFELPNAKFRSVVTIQDLIPLEYPPSMPNPIRRAIFKEILRESARIASRIVVPSEQTARSVEKLGVANEKVRVVPLGVSSHFRPLSEVEQAAARARFGGGGRYIAFLEHSKPHKNAGIMERVAQKLSDADLIVVGAGQSRVPATNHIPTPTDSDLRLFYGGAETFVLPSLIEGFGLPAVEALACGTPVVVGLGLGALPYIKPGAIEVDVTNPQEIANAVLDLVKDGSFRDHLSERGIAVAQIMTAAATAKATFAIYKETLS